MQVCVYVRERERERVSTVGEGAGINSALLTDSEEFLSGSERRRVETKSTHTR